MAQSAQSVLEVRTAGSDSSGGGFSLAGNTYSITNLAGTSATSSAPVVSSASYTFVAGDVGHYLWIASGTNWTPGLYVIASVAAGAATLTRACATTASPTSGSASVDRSQADAAFTNGTNLTVDASVNTRVVPDGYTVVTADVGNWIQITTTGGGAAFTVGFYQIISVSAGNYWTLDRSPAATSSAGATWAMGGAILTFAKLATAMVASNKAFIKGGAGYTSNATTTFSLSTTPSNSQLPSRLIGYTSTRGDNGRATLTLQTNTGLTGLLINGTGWVVENIAVDCGSLGTSTGIKIASNYIRVRNCKVSNFTVYGIWTFSANYAVYDNEITGGTSAATAAIGNAASPAGWVVRNNVHDNACVGIIVGNAGNAAAIRNRVTNNTGASSDGIQTGWGNLIEANTVYGSGRHGINQTLIYGQIPNLFRNNVLVSNGGYGLVVASSAGCPADAMYDGNAFYGNTSGARSNADDLTTNLVDSVAPYTNVNDIILSGDPFTNVAGGDFTLNNTFGAGAAVRGHGTPGTLPGASETGYTDMGVFQHQETTPASVAVSMANTSGGFQN